MSFANSHLWIVACAGVARVDGSDCSRNGMAEVGTALTRGDQTAFAQDSKMAMPLCSLQPDWSRLVNSQYTLVVVMQFWH